MPTRSEILNLILSRCSNKRYLEVGVSKGETFREIKASLKTAVDPLFDFDIAQAISEQPNADFHQVPSDTYFKEICSHGEKFDLIYLDGLHTFEQTLRDFTNATERLAEGGVIVIDDVVPSTYHSSLPNQLDAFVMKDWTKDQDSSWMGDVYKLVYFVDNFFVDYQLRTTSDNHGQAIIWKSARQRTPMHAMSVSEIGSADFLSVAQLEAVYQKMPHAEIVSEIFDTAPTEPDGTSNKRQNDTAGSTKEQLAPGMTVNVVDVLAYENIGIYDSKFRDHLVKDIYSGRQAQLDPINIESAANGVVYPDAEYALVLDGRISEDQQPPWNPIINQNVPSLEIVDETVLIARFGYATWGHWIGEMLPKLVLVEQAYPGRYKFAVPQQYREEGYETYMQSLKAYGIDETRLVFLENGFKYVMHNLALVSPIWSSHVMHPTAAASMRKPFKAKSAERRCRLALARGKDAQRQVENWKDVEAVLTDLKFEIVDPAALDFVSQVTYAQRADVIVGILGSGLMSILYAELGIKVLSLAPTFFGDRFFYALVGNRRGRYADIRGPLVTPHPSIAHRGSFSVQIDKLVEGLKALHVS